MSLPEGADPFALLRVNDQILVSDFRLDRIYRYNIDGQMLGDFNPPEINKLREKLAQQRKFYQHLDSGLTILFAASLVGGLVLAFYLQSRQDKGVIEQYHYQPIEQESIDDDPVEHWINPSLRFKLVGCVGFLLITGLLLFAFALEWMRGSDLQTFLDQIKWLLLLCALVLIVFLSQLRRRIGVSEHRLFIRPALGTQKICPKNSILYHDMSIVIGQSLFDINQLYYLFTANDVENYLYPSIKQGQHVERTDMQKVLGRNMLVRLFQVAIISGLAGSFIYHALLK